MPGVGPRITEPQVNHVSACRMSIFPLVFLGSLLGPSWGIAEGVYRAFAPKGVYREVCRGGVCRDYAEPLPGL